MPGSQQTTEAGTTIGFYSNDPDEQPLDHPVIEHGDFIKLNNGEVVIIGKAAGDEWVKAATKAAKKVNRAVDAKVAAQKAAAAPKGRKRTGAESTVRGALAESLPKSDTGKVALAAIPVGTLATVAAMRSPAGQERIAATKERASAGYKASRDTRHYRPASPYYDDALGKADIAKALRVDSEGRTERISEKARKLNDRAAAKERLSASQKRIKHGPARAPRSEAVFSNAAKVRDLLPKTPHGKIALAAAVPATIAASRLNKSDATIAAEELLSKGVAEFLRGGKWVTQAAGSTPPKAAKVRTIVSGKGGSTQQVFQRNPRFDQMSGAADTATKKENLGVTIPLATAAGSAAIGGAKLAHGAVKARAANKVAAKVAAEQAARRARHKRTALIAGASLLPAATVAATTGRKRNDDPFGKGLANTAMTLGPAALGVAMSAKQLKNLVAAGKASKAELAAFKAHESAAKHAKRAAIAAPVVAGVGGALAGAATGHAAGAKSVEKADIAKVALPGAAKRAAKKVASARAAANANAQASAAAHANATRQAHAAQGGIPGSNPTPGTTNAKGAFRRFVDSAKSKAQGVNLGAVDNNLKSIDETGKRLGEASAGYVRTARNMRGTADEVRRIMGGQHPKGAPGITPSQGVAMGAAGAGGLLIGRQLAGPKPYPYQQQQA